MSGGEIILESTDIVVEEIRTELHAQELVSEVRVEEVVEGDERIFEVILQGRPGPRGSDAYEVAVEEGFLGSRQDWLDSLVGTVPSYTHEQLSPSTTWIANHNLGYRPNVSVVNSGGQEVDVEISHTTVNQTVISSNVAFSGLARFI
jgi:hypothetical protein